MSYFVKTFTQFRSSFRQVSHKTWKKQLVISYSLHRVVAVVQMRAKQCMHHLHLRVHHHHHPHPIPSQPELPRSAGNIHSRDVARPTTSTASFYVTVKKFGFSYCDFLNGHHNRRPVGFSRSRRCSRTWWKCRSGFFVLKSFGLISFMSFLLEISS